MELRGMLFGERCGWNTHRANNRANNKANSDAKFTYKVNNGKDDESDDEGSDSGLATVTSKPKLQRPPMYKVLIMNDDYTPMEFVVHVLEAFFAMSHEKATQLMLTVHTQGSAVAGIFPRDLAETKSEQVNQFAQENQHPLMSTIEMTD